MYSGNILKCRLIPLTCGQFAIVNESDYERIMSIGEWSAIWYQNTDSFYSERKMKFDNRMMTQRMHREILGLKPGDPEYVDHINHDTLDNRRSNLHKTNCRGNSENRLDQSMHGPGIERIYNGKFRARARLNGKNIHLGYHKTMAEAQTARSAFLKKEA